ncbi:hypothetical protein VTH06DRAFT_4293 [Thermothelomyces fergusii]
MDLLMDGAPMDGGDGAGEQMQGIQGIQGIQGMEGLEGMEGMEGVEGMGGMNGMDGMDGMDGMGGAMALDEVDLFGDPDGMSIDLRFIRCNPDTTEWELSEPSSWSPPLPSASAPGLAAAPNPPNPISPASAGAPFVHLAWSPTMSPELAAFDALGRLTLLNFSISSNQPYSRRWEADVADDLHAVVGCYWLPPAMPQNKQFHLIHGPAVKSHSEYRYEHQFYAASGPWHPNPSRSALLCVTTNGALRLFYLQSNGRLEETALELESVTSSDDLITHASLCSDKSKHPLVDARCHICPPR